MFRVNGRSNTKGMLNAAALSCGSCGLLYTSRNIKSWKFVNSAQLSPHKYSYYNFYFSNYATKAKPKATKASKFKEPPEEPLTPEETAKVLKVVNEVQQAEDLLKYIIPKKKAEELISKKDSSDNKQITSLDEITYIVGPKNSSKFFCSVLKKPIPVNINAAMFPVVSDEEIGRISKVLSIIIVGDKISWCLVQRLGEENVQLSLETFQQASYPFKPRMHFLTLLNEMEIVVDQLPEAELYIVEEYPSTVPTPYMFTFQLQMAQARSTIVGLLTSKTEESKIISMKTVAVARLFNTYIGSEKVSGQYIVENILLYKNLPFLKVADSMIQNYKTADTKLKEGLSQAILLNLAYWKLTQQIKHLDS